MNSPSRRSRDKSAPKKRTRKSKAKPDTAPASSGEPTTQEIYDGICAIFGGDPVTQLFEFDPAMKFFRDSNRATVELTNAAYKILKERQPMTLRGLHYQLVVTGFYANDRNSYQRLSRTMVKAREARVIPWEWLVDSIRQTLKPSSWSGLEDYGDVIRSGYRKSFWPRMPDYVALFCEKDAMAAAIEPATDQYDVPLHIVRGYVSASYSHSIGAQWKHIEKPVHAYYLGDWDPSGLDLERNLREDLANYSGRKLIDVPALQAQYPGRRFQHGSNDLIWTRLAVEPSDFEEFELAPLMAKKTDSRFATFVKEHGHHCAELDAIPIDVLRERVDEAILAHVDIDEWNRLLAVEQVERETIENFVESLTGGHTDADQD